MNEELNATTATCPVTGKRNVDLCVPVSVIPFAQVGKITTECVGKPSVESKDKCPGKTNENCNFIIKQTISVEVPVEFGAKVTTGETFVVCGKLSDDEDNDCEDEDNDCDDDEDEDEDEDEDNQNENNNRRMSFFGR